MSQFRFEKFVQHRLDVGVPAALVQWVDDQGEEKLVWMDPADIRNNVLMHGPHYGLLVAASHYHMKADQLVALHRSKGKNKAFLQPMEPVRNQDGLWTHQDFPLAEEGQLSEDSFSEWLYVIGFESRFETPPYCGNCESDIADWEPTSPAGDGWFVGSIHETEDDPCAVCVWLRKLEVA